MRRKTNKWNIIYSDDSKQTSFNKIFVYHIRHMKNLKLHNLWWEEDEVIFQEKYGFSSYLNKELLLEEMNKYIKRRGRR